MNDYTPDRWVLIRITRNDEVCYRVFGSWTGGYLDNDRWRVNSGVKQVITKPDSDVYEVIGYSGSVYHCLKACYGIAGAYNRAQLAQLLEAAPLASVVDEEEVADVMQGLEWVERDVGQLVSEEAPF